MSRWFGGLRSRLRSSRASGAVEKASDGDQRSVVLFGYPTAETFVEKDYLDFNPDIAHAVRVGAFKSGREHFRRFGSQRTHKVRFKDVDDQLASMRLVKAAKIAEIMKPLFSSMSDASGVFDCLTPGMKKSFGVIDASNVSSNDYDQETMELINDPRNALMLDCGAGSRPTYFSNVVNYEIARYKSTDVVGVAEVLPFKDDSFDVVLSYAVLEHVKQPFVAARELIRVLKPGGILRVQVPFLQPLHGFPSHYFNMTQFGVRALFEEHIDIEKQFVAAGPIWTMYTLIRAWHAGLPKSKQDAFLQLTLNDLFVHPIHLLSRDFVVGVSEAANFEIASCTGLIGRKRVNPKVNEYELHHHDDTQSSA